MSHPVGYRMDRLGKIFVRFPDGKERPATPHEVHRILVDRPDVTMAMSM